MRGGVHGRRGPSRPSHAARAASATVFSPVCGASSNVALLRFVQRGAAAQRSKVALKLRHLERGLGDARRAGAGEEQTKEDNVRFHGGGDEGL
jgi:hypothetical protein